MTAQDNKATLLAFIGQVSNQAELVPVVKRPRPPGP